MSTALAIDGGPKACPSWPARRLFGVAEKQAVMQLFDHSIEKGEAFGYNGPEEEAYCREFAAYLGGGYADAVNSGSSAVYVAIKAVRVPAFSEVICGPISDPGGIMPIALAGCIPIIADAAPGSFNISPESIASRITRRTSAIVVAHIAGIPADMDPIMALARKHKLVVIEDCAQAHAAKYKGRFVGTIGHAGAFSTMFGKHHATGGQGGMVFTKDRETYRWARRFSDRGKPFEMKNARGNVVASHNLNLNDLSACIGRAQLKKLPGIAAARRRTAEATIAGCKRCLKTVRIVEGLPRTEPSYWFLFAQLDLARLRVDKATFVKALQAEGVPVGESYLHLFTDADWYRNRAVFEGSDYPWGSPLYKGNPNRVYPTPNIRATDTYTFFIPWHERLTATTARQVLAALKKVEQAYAK